MKIKTSLSLGAVLLTSLFMSACSQQGSGNVAGQQSENESVSTGTTMAKGVEHTHPANECTNSISHTHPNGGGVHKHRYSCKPKMARTADEHTHPANKCTRSISHAHPNGKRTHAHRYSCQGTAKNVGMNANQHRHPANKCTRSISHAHPNGKRTHAHRYSCQGNTKNVGANQHRHPANKCTRSIAHSHPNGKRDHKHSYSCKSNGGVKNYNLDQLRHMAQLVLSGNYTQGTQKSNTGTGHLHPANSMTRSIRHNHPNGDRKHSHHYGM